VLAVFRSELRQFMMNTPIISKSGYRSGQETNAMSTINEHSKEAEKES
jgi:hypothetical protein